MRLFSRSPHRGIGVVQLLTRTHGINGEPESWGGLYTRAYSAFSDLAWH